MPESTPVFFLLWLGFVCIYLAWGWAGWLIAVAVTFAAFEWGT